jgi:hypothetical protein
MRPAIRLCAVSRPTLACLLLAATVIIVAAVLAYHVGRPNRVTDRQMRQLARALRPLTPPGWQLNAERTNPFASRAPEAFPGATFTFRGEAPPPGQAIKRVIPLVEVIVIPQSYRPRLMPPPGVAWQFGPYPPQYLGQWKGLEVYACRNAGLPLPETGPVTTKDIAKPLGLPEPKTTGMIRRVLPLPAVNENTTTQARGQPRTAP